MGELRRAAFGDFPAVSPAVLASAVTGPPRARLLAAILLGAQGRYAAAAALLDQLGREADPVIAALALTTFASHRRQLGGHAAAFGPDGAALRLVAGRSGAEDPDGLDAAGASADAVLGLAADNLGVGRLTVARRLLSRAAPAGWRSRVRAGWVTAEIELADGHAEAALAPAEAALTLATAQSARRHVTKSQLVLAAALGATGDKERAVHLAEEALGVSEEFELRSLSWPAGLLAAEHRPDVHERYRFRVDAVLHAVLLRTDPEGRRLARDSPWVPG
jgi:tetratricopeptide (TPR) repeat protein